MVDIAIAALTLTVSVTIEPLSDLGSASSWLEVFHASVHGFDVASNLSILVSKFILLHLNAASISS